MPTDAQSAWVVVAAYNEALVIGRVVSDLIGRLRAMTRHGASKIRLRQSRMAHASEILHAIAHSGLRYLEVLVTIEYSTYSLAKGQRLADLLKILVDLSAHRLHR